MESSCLPEHLRDEHKWLQRQKWLRSEKTFSEPNTFVLTHLACLGKRGAFNIHPGSFHFFRNLECMLIHFQQALQSVSQQQVVLPEAIQPGSKFNLTGLDIIELRFPTDVFFSIFRVNVQPFPTHVCCQMFFLVCFIQLVSGYADPGLLRNIFIMTRSSLVPAPFSHIRAH